MAPFLQVKIAQKPLALHCLANHRGSLQRKIDCRLFHFERIFIFAQNTLNRNERSGADTFAPRPISSPG